MDADPLTVFADYFANTDTPFKRDGTYLSAEALIGLLGRHRLLIQNNDGVIHASMRLSHARSERGKELVVFLGGILNERIDLTDQDEMWWSMCLDYAWNDDAIAELLQQIAEEIIFIESFLGFGMTYQDEPLDSLLMRTFDQSHGRV